MNKKKESKIKPLQNKTKQNKTKQNKTKKKRREETNTDGAKKKDVPSHSARCMHCTTSIAGIYVSSLHFLACVLEALLTAMNI